MTFCLDLEEYIGVLQILVGHKYSQTLDIVCSKVIMPVQPPHSVCGDLKSRVEARNPATPQEMYSELAHAEQGHL